MPADMTRRERVLRALEHHLAGLVQVEDLTSDEANAIIHAADEVITDPRR